MRTPPGRQASQQLPGPINLVRPRAIIAPHCMPSKRFLGKGARNIATRKEIVQATASGNFSDQTCISMGRTSCQCLASSGSDYYDWYFVEAIDVGIMQDSTPLQRAVWLQFAAPFIFSAAQDLLPSTVRSHEEHRGIPHGSCRSMSEMSLVGEGL